MITRLVIFVPAVVLGSAAVLAASAVGPVGLRVPLVVAAAAALTLLVGRAATLFGQSSSESPGEDRRSGTDRRSGEDRRAHAFEALQDNRRPTLDRETGLCTAWFFRLRAEDEIARGERYGMPFSVVVCEGADGVTTRIAGRALKSVLREIDYAGDLGTGIAVILPNTNRDGADTLAARLQDVAGVAVTRVAAFPGDGNTLAQLLGEPEWRTSEGQRSA